MFLNSPFLLSRSLFIDAVRFEARIHVLNTCSFKCVMSIYLTAAQYALLVIILIHFSYHFIVRYIVSYFLWSFFSFFFEESFKLLLYFILKRNIFSLMCQNGISCVRREWKFSCFHHDVSSASSHLLYSTLTIFKKRIIQCCCWKGNSFQWGDFFFLLFSKKKLNKIKNTKKKKDSQVCLYLVLCGVK